MIIRLAEWMNAAGNRGYAASSVCRLRIPYIPRGAFRASTPIANRIIARTTDGGQNWVSENSGTDYGLSKISCTGPRSGTTVGYGGAILRREAVR
jgi:hypothetical protein